MATAPATPGTYEFQPDGSFIELTLNGEVMRIKEAKQLPASD